MAVVLATSIVSEAFIDIFVCAEKCLGCYTLKIDALTWARTSMQVSYFLNYVTLQKLDFMILHKVKDQKQFPTLPSPPSLSKHLYNNKNNILTYPCLRAQLHLLL